MTILLVCVILVAIAIGAWAVWVAPYRFRLARRTIVFDKPGLPDAGKHGRPITILHLSDMHFQRGDVRKRRFIQSLVQHPVDFVAVTGDLTDDDGGHEECIEALRGLKGLRGNYAVLGSHDYHFHGFWNVVKHFLIPGDRSWSGPNSVDRLIQRLAEVGVRVLRNESLRVDVDGKAVRIVGLDDPYLKLHNTAAAMDGARPDEFKIMLVHTPEALDEAGEAGLDLVIAGHTHGGQVRLPGIGAAMTHCALSPRFASGTFKIARTVVHLNNGLGAGRFTNIRLLCPPEATLLTITRKS